MRKQLGQSMTEYLVVLGVTGAALLAATTDVTNLFSNVQDSYRTQSSEMNKVQIYGSPKFQTNPITREEGDGDDGDTPQDVPVNNPTRDYPPVISMVFDSTGKEVGTLNENNEVVDQAGNVVGTCKRITEGPKIGQCEFVDPDTGQPIDGWTIDSQWVDDQGNPLQLHALSRGQEVVGFAYFYNNNFYDSVTRKRLDPQPTNLSSVQTRPVTTLDGSGKPFISGREANGYIYSESSVQLNTQDFSTAKKIEGELVTVTFEDPQLPLSDPKKYKPCVVTENKWNNNMPGFLLNMGAGDELFLNRIRYIDVPAEGCNGRNSVTLKANGDWVIN